MFKVKIQQEEVTGDFFVTFYNIKSGKTYVAEPIDLKFVEKVEDIDDPDTEPTIKLPALEGEEFFNAFIKEINGIREYMPRDAVVPPTATIAITSTDTHKPIRYDDLWFVFWI